MSVFSASLEHISRVDIHPPVAPTPLLTVSATGLVALCLGHDGSPRHRSVTAVTPRHPLHAGVQVVQLATLANTLVGAVGLRALYQVCQFAGGAIGRIRIVHAVSEPSWVVRDPVQV